MESMPGLDAGSVMTVPSDSAAGESEDGMLSLVEFDDAPEREVVEEEPFDPDVRLIPIKCLSCDTRFYGSENQIGKYRRCPDCDRLNLVPELEPEYRITVEISPNGGYIVHDPEITHRPIPRRNADYRVIPYIQRNEAIPEEVYITPPVDLPKGPAAEAKPKTPVVEAPPILPEEAFIPKEIPRNPGALVKNFFSPFLNPKSRYRLLLLTFLGFFGGLFTIQMVTWVVQGLTDTIPDKPNHIYTNNESLIFLFNYFVGVPIVILGLILVFIFSIVICLNSYGERDNSTRWGTFDTDFGLSIFVWCFLVMMAASVPGVAAGFTIMAFLTEAVFGRGCLILSLLIGDYIFFPVIFLAILENDLTYVFDKPKRVYRSFARLFGTWLLFYLTSAVIFAVCLTPVTVLSILKSRLNEDSANFHFTVFYALSFTLAGVFTPLLYFRLLGRMGWIIREVIELPDAPCVEDEKF
jgi:hypothetical protein